jgi:hypothetical protein
LLFRSLDIETVPDFSIWSPGEPTYRLTCGQLAPKFSSSLPAYQPYVEAVEPFPPPHAHRVVAVAWTDVEAAQDPARKGADGRAYRIYRCVAHERHCGWSSQAPESEERMLVAAVAAAQAERPATLVTWNGRTFDLPVLSMRALHLGIPWGWYYEPTSIRYRYTEDGHCDLMDFFSDYGAGKNARLDNVAKLIGLPGKTDTDGSMVADIVAQGDDQDAMARVGRYCGHDTLQTAIIFLRSRYHLGRLTAEGYNESLETFAPVLAAEGLPADMDRLRMGA